MILSHHARALQLFGFPFVFPVALPRRWVEVLEPIVEKMMTWDLCPSSKKHISKKICDFRFFSFDLYIDSILKQLNKLKNIILFFSLFLFLCGFPFCFPVVLPYCIPPLHYPVVGSKSSSLPFRQRARARKGGEAGPRTSTRFPEIQCQLSAGNHNGLLTGK